MNLIPVTAANLALAESRERRLARRIHAEWVDNRELLHDGQIAEARRTAAEARRLTAEAAKLGAAIDTYYASVG